MKRRTLIALCGSVCVMALPCAVHSQTVRGVVVDRNEQPVAGAVVLLVDSASGVAARALSGASGAYRLAAPAPGTYRVRTLRIGFRPEETAPMALERGREREQRISLAGIQISLDTVRVVDRSMCGATSDSALAVYSVWEQARTALNATQLAASAGVVQATTVLYERTLAPGAKQILAQTASLRTGFVSRPWLTATPEALHRAGYVVENPDNTTTYYAPGVDVLLSPGFVADHCFRLAGGRGAPRGSIGVAFEPTRDRRDVPEIRGTLWLDRKSAQLRELQFKFTNVTREQEDNAGGEMAFAVLGNGAWSVTRWSIRMPVIEQVVRSQALGGTRLRVAELHVRGGELALVTRLAAGGTGRDTIWSQPTTVDLHARLAGLATDSAGGPIAGVEIAIPDLSLRASTDSRGRFELAAVPAGERRVVARRVGYGAAEVTLTFQPGATLVRRFVLSPVRTLDSVVVRATYADPLMREFEEHRRIGLGHFVTREALERIRGQRLTRALEGLPGIIFSRGGVSHAWLLSKRGHASLCPPVRPGAHSSCYYANGIYNPSPAEAARGVGAGCYVMVFLDNTQLNAGHPTPPFDASTLAVDEVEAIEYYAGVSELPARYSVLSADCGVLVIHTRRP